MTASTPERILVTDAPDIAGDKGAIYQIREGLINAASDASTPALDEIPEEALDSDYGHPSFSAWGRLVDEAADSIAPQVAKVLEAAIAERLPWTWEPER